MPNQNQCLLSVTAQSHYPKTQKLKITLVNYSSWFLFDRNLGKVWLGRSSSVCFMQL